MSGLQSITYQAIIDAIKTYIKSNCLNISNYSGINIAYKSGYSGTSTIPGGNAAATCYCTYTLSANPVVQVASSVVDADMTNFISQIQLTAKLNSNIASSEFLNFINDIVSFCSSRMAYATSQYATTKQILIYSTSNTSYSSLAPITTDEANKLMETNDINSVVNAVVNVTKQNIRCIPCKYTFSYS